MKFLLPKAVSSNLSAGSPSSTQGGSVVEIKSTKLMETSSENPNGSSNVEMIGTGLIEVEKKSNTDIDKEMEPPKQKKIGRKSVVKSEIDAEKDGPANSNTDLE